MAFNSITNAEIAVGKPGKQSLWQKVKDNLDFLFGTTNATGLANGSFELDSDADGIPDSWTRSLYPGGSGGFETTSPEHGAKSYYFTHPGGAGNGGGYLESDYIECSEVEQLSLKHHIRSSVTGIRNLIRVQFYTKAKVFIVTDTLYNATAPDTAAYYKSYNFTPPSTARYLKVFLIGGYTDTAVAGTTYFDGVKLDHVILAAVGQGQLKTTTGSVSNSTITPTNLTLPGGNYGFYPQIKSSNAAINGAATFLHSAAGASGNELRSNQSIGTSYVANITLQSDNTNTLYAQQRYIQASPPYKIGDKVWGHFLFLLRDIATGTVRSAYEAEDPPWAYNGAVWLPKDDSARLSEVPHPFADYWQKDPAVDGLEIVMVDLSERNVKQVKEDAWRTGQGLLENIPALIAGKGMVKAHADYLLPEIARFTNRVKIVAP